MRVTLTKQLIPTEQEALSRWLMAVLENDGLTSDAGFPIAGLYLYLDNRPCLLISGYWERAQTSIILARRSPYGSELVDVQTRLATLLGLVQMCPPSSELTEAATHAIMRYLLGEYQEMNANLISSPLSTSNGLAFSSDNRAASLIGNEWMLPSGEVVDVTGWTICATGLPPVEPPVVEPTVVALPIAAEEFSETTDEEFPSSSIG